MVKPRITPEARMSDWAMDQNRGKWAISSKRKLKEEQEPGQESIGYSLGGPDSREGRAMAKITGRKTYYEDSGKWVIKGAELIRHLKKGPINWNVFRSSHKRYRPLLNTLGLPNGAHFEDYDFSNAKLVGVDYHNVKFCGGDLSNIDAKGASFNNCSFKRTYLASANFFNAKFEFCDFTDCDLTDAFLVRALFRHCKMDGASFATAEFGETEFINVSLAGARGLGKAKHEGPSYLDMTTLKQSLPLWFMRGVGLSEEIISAQPLFGAEASSYYSCFISFSAKDQKFAEKLYEDLQAKGVRCWFAPHDLLIGAATLDEIIGQISRLDKLIVVLSNASIKSRWVQDEVLKGYAEERRRNDRILLPVRLDEAVMRTREPWAVKLRDQVIGNFRSWKTPATYKRAFYRLLKSLQRQQ